MNVFMAATSNEKADKSRRTKHSTRNSEIQPTFGRLSRKICRMTVRWSRKRVKFGQNVDKHLSEIENSRQSCIIHRRQGEQLGPDEERAAQAPGHAPGPGGAAHVPEPDPLRQGHRRGKRRFHIVKIVVKFAFSII